MNIPDRVTVVRRNPDGTEYTQAVGACAITPDVAVPAEFPPGFNSRYHLTEEEMARGFAAPEDGEPFQFGAD